eukprot:scaffold1624_cov105-Cylindrotheca_fusiformis.AAC.3
MTTLSFDDDESVDVERPKVNNPNVDSPKNNGNADEAANYQAFEEPAKDNQASEEAAKDYQASKEPVKDYQAYEEPAKDYQAYEEPARDYQAYEDHPEPDMTTSLKERSFDEDVSCKSLPFDEHSKYDSVPPSLQAVNIANLLAFLANATVVVALGATNLSDLPTNAEVTAQYPTLMTPAGYVFLIWVVILVSQLVWAVCQLFPNYRSIDLVIEGVGWNYVWACVAQIAWTGFFTMERLLLSFAAIVMVCVPLVMVVLKMDKIERKDDSNKTYAIFRFPFESHAAWIMAATLVNANMVLVDFEISKTIQVVAAVFTLVALAGVGFYCTLHGQYAIPSVLGWASLAVAVKLSDPMNVSMVERFPSHTVAAIEFSAGGLAAFLWMAIIAREYVIRKAKQDSAEGKESDDDYVKL